MKRMRIKKMGKYNVYLEETVPSNTAEKPSWHVTAHNPITSTDEDLGHHSSEEAALDAAKKFCSG